MIRAPSVFAVSKEALVICSEHLLSGLGPYIYFTLTMTEKNLVVIGSKLVTL